ncbi:NADH:flavin oxidoreductase [Sphingosinicella soli]|uniref:2,4-dienoyl-CoA reductase-like NADH-dependent reductase (Old Yellow Enzyme family) n=1 Tax=Sphingosinicella soli TaxID=333708 RepID=A0A7W7FAM4_9SPHN|nr:NADH:flavin oxidoreductase [Sphingosinicella soli]MBB4633833.1 2,4-dienoyl-CoA reductase-like NADH-dependent reductase (Old Yellow Enzyme family) [Sphingosinicella soli]
MDSQVHLDSKALFDPITIGKLLLKSRIVMSPMTRSMSPGGVPTADVAAYYRRRAEADVGLIVTEGTWVSHPGASNDDNVPRFFGEDAMAGWSKVVDEVHAAGGRIVPQLWHVGLFQTAAQADGSAASRQVGPSGMVGAIGEAPTLRASAMTDKDIEDVVDAFGSGAETAMKLGFDGIAFHGAHGYLLDQFLWAMTNMRDAPYGGGIGDRARFPAQIIAECRRRTHKDFPIIFRLSQWKLQDYGAKLVSNPAEMETLLRPLIDAGVDIFDCSQRRFWEPEFAGSDTNLAGWVKKVGGLPTMTVGSVGLSTDLMTSLRGIGGEPAGLDRLIEMIERGDFDLVAVGRALLVDPRWAQKIRQGRFDELSSFKVEALATLT